MLHGMEMMGLERFPNAALKLMVLLNQLSRAFSRRGRLVTGRKDLAIDDYRKSGIRHVRSWREKVCFRLDVAMMKP